MRQLTTLEVLKHYGFDDERGFHALVHGWFGHDAVIGILCEVIDESGSLDDVEEFLKETAEQEGRCISAPSKDDN